MMQQSVEAVIRDRGSDEVISVPAAATVMEAVGVMQAREVGAVMVMTEDGLFGGAPALRSFRATCGTPISLVMTRDIRFVSPGTTIEAALSLMHVQRFRHLLVIDGPKVHGLISMRDLVNQMIRHGEGRFEAAVRDTGAGAGT